MSKTNDFRDFDGTGPLSEAEIALVQAHRKRQVERADALRRFEPNHVASKPLVETGAPTVYPVTNDRAKLGEWKGTAHHFEIAWRIFGNLVYWGKVTVDFTDPRWAEDVRNFIDDITQVLIEE